MSHRHSDDDAGAALDAAATALVRAADEGDAALLDAARECVLAVGVRRTTFSDVARRAGVSRMTLYRRFGDLEALLSALMTREFGRLVAAAREHARELPTTRERVVATVVHGARALAADPLFGRLVDLDPELLLPYVTVRLGGVQRMAVAGTTEDLAAGAHDGSVRTDVPPAALAAAIELMVRGFVLAAHAERAAALDPWAELGRAVDGYLRP
jgi:AcrR family transcriptional regulator